MTSRATHQRRRSILAPGINLTPLLDVIFNLLFFFLLATTLRNEEAQTEITLPDSDMAVRADSGQLAIDLNAQGEIFYQGRPMVAEELELEMIALVQEGETEVLIRGDRDVGLGKVYAVMDLCRRAGLKAVSLQAEPKPANDR